MHDSTWPKRGLWKTHPQLWRPNLGTKPHHVSSRLLGAGGPSLGSPQGPHCSLIASPSSWMFPGAVPHGSPQLLPAALLTAYPQRLWWPCPPWAARPLDD
jgi:hypothetical protein